MNKLENVNTNPESKEGENLSFTYPYDFSYQPRECYELIGGISAEEAREVISEAEGPIVEIGGPSDEGFFYLDGVELSSKPIITNRVSFSSTIPDREETGSLDSHIDDFFDGRDMPYEDDSLGVVMMSFITRAEDKEFFLEDREATQEELDILNQRFDVAKKEIESFVEGSLELEDVKESFLLKIYQEVLRVLRPGGLFIANSNEAELKSIEKMGFEIVSLYIDRDEEPSFEFVARKPGNVLNIDKQ